MEYSVRSQAEKLNKEHYKKRKWQKVVTVLASIVVFCTTYALILPALTWERQLVCEREEHQHTEDCYEVITVSGEKILECPLTEHVHGADYRIRRYCVHRYRSHSRNQEEN